MDFLSPNAPLKTSVSESAVPNNRLSINVPLPKINESLNEPEEESAVEIAAHARRRRGSIKINTTENEVHEIEGNPTSKSEMSFPGRRQHRRSTVVDIASLMIGGNEQNRDSQTQNDILLARRRSTRNHSFVDLTRRYSMANKHKKQARNQPKCIFEVSRHTVKGLVEKIKEEAEKMPKSRATDLIELINLLQNLSTSTFSEREQFEEEYIKFHIAQKRMQDFPKHFQDEVDTMALEIRQENFNLIDKLKSHRRHIEAELLRFDVEGQFLEKSNSNLLEQKELSEELISQLVAGLNQRMSLKAQTQIQVNKTKEEIGLVIAQTEGLPEKLEMLAINIGGDIDELKFNIQESLIDSEKYGVLIIKTADEIVEIKRESDLLVEEVKEHDRVIKKGNLVQEDRLKRILKESEAHNRVATNKRLVHADKTENRDRALESQKNIGESDDREIASWEERIEELRQKIKQTNAETKENLIEMHSLRQKESETKANIDTLEQNLKYFLGEMEEHNTETEKCRKVYDDLQDEKGYRNEKLKKNIQDAKITKNQLDEELERLKKRHLVANEARVQIVAAWTECDNAITESKKNLFSYKTENNKITLDLEKESQTLADTVYRESESLTKLKQKTIKMHQKLQTDSETFETNEENMRQKVKDISSTLESNIQIIEELRSILKFRQPVYEDHQVDAYENEELYEEAKQKLVRVQNREKDILAKIKRTEKSTALALDKFRQKKSDKDNALEDTKSVIASKSEIIKELDRDNYELLLEWEQYNQENCRINYMIKTASRHIVDMKQDDTKISVQLVEYLTIHKNLQDELQQYRTVFNDFCYKSDRDGQSILYGITNFEGETHRRCDVLSHVEKQLSSIAAQFESYADDTKRPKEQEKKKLIKKKRKFRVGLPVDVDIFNEISRGHKSRHCITNIVR